MSNEWKDGVSPLIALSRLVPRIMDILGALLFLLLLIYFIQKKNKDFVEYILMVLVGIAFVLDVTFVVMYFNGV